MNKEFFARQMRKAKHKAMFFSKHLSRPVSKLLFVAAPFMSAYASQESFKAAVLVSAAAVFLAIAAEVVARATRSYDDIPVPVKRFTKESSSSITVDDQSLEEMILFVNDIENYLERIGRI